MGWENVDQSSSKKAPILVAGDCKKPTRIRLLAGPGKRYEEPDQIFQHWGPQGSGFPPFACGDPSGKDCIFHAEPLAWRVNKINVMNVIVYGEKQEETAIKVLQAPATLMVAIRDQSRSINVDPLSVDWIILRSGEGMQGTKYTATPAPGMPMHPNIDLSQWPAQEADFALDACPALIDYDKIDGYLALSAAEQSKRLDEILENKSKKNAGAAGNAPAAPPAPAAGNVPPAAPPAPAAAPPAPAPAPAPAAPPAPAPAAAAPPPAPPAPAPAPAAPPPIDPKVAARAVASPWPDRFATMGDVDPTTLKWMIDNEAQFTAFPQQIGAAKILFGTGAPAPAAAPAAANGAAQDVGALKARMGELLQSTPVLADLTNARNFFEKLTGQKAINKMSAEQLALCVSTAEQGEAAIRAVIG